MKKSTLLLSSLTLLAAAAGTLFADEISLSEDYNSPTTLGNTTEEGAGNTYTLSKDGDADGILFWTGEDGVGGAVVNLNIGFAGTIKSSGTGSKCLIMLYCQGSGDNVENIDLTAADFSGFTGKLLISNKWNNSQKVRVSSDKFKNVEFVFAGRTIDGSGEWSSNYERGHGNKNRGVDTLHLTGDTTFAGITGATKGVTATYEGVTTVINTKEFITVETSGTTLTLAGAGEYAFYGTVGTSSARLSLTQASTAGTGTQTFGGTNNLQNVTVSSGTLKLAGTTNVAGMVTVSGGTLNLDGTVTLSGGLTVSGGDFQISESANITLSGTIDLSSAIINPGTITVGSNTVFELGNLTADEGVYTLISGVGTINGWTGDGGLGKSNFTIFGASLSERQTVNISEVGKVTVSGYAGIVWDNGGSGTWNSTSQWRLFDGTNSYDLTTLRSNDNVFFTASSAQNIEITESVTVGSVVFYDGSHELTKSDGVILTADELIVRSGATLTLGNDVLGTSLVSNQGTLNMSDTTFAGTNSGTMNLSGTSTFSGTNTGTLNITAGTTSWAGTNSGSIDISEGAILDLGTGESNIEINLSGSGTVKYVSTKRDHGTTFNLGSFAGTLDFAGRFNPKKFTGSYVKQIVLSSGTMWGGDNCSFAKAILFKTDYQIGDSSSTSITLSGDLEIAAGKTLTVGGTGTTLTISKSLVINDNAVFKTSSGTTTISGTVSGTGSFNVAGGTLKFSGTEGTINASSLTISGASSTVTFSKDATFSGVILTTSNNAEGRSITINDGATVSASSLENSWGLNNLTVNGTLNLTGDTGTNGLHIQNVNTNTITGAGTINAYRLTPDKSDGSNPIKLDGGIKINLGKGGIANSYTQHAVLQILNATIGAQTGCDFTVSAENIQLGGGTGGVTFNTNGQTITVSSALADVSGQVGKLTKTGAGTLKLSAANTFTGGTTISAGILEVGNASALGTGAVTISGGQLKISDSVTLNNTALTIVVGDGDYTNDGNCAIVGGTGAAFVSETTITIEKAAVEVAAVYAMSLENPVYYISSGLDLTGVTISLGTGFEGYSYNIDGNVLTLTIPEPSAFGLLAGLGALALAGTRRRRKVK